ncbi:MAG: glutaredoxin family protein [Spirochaetaceae bacterium]|nr:MAG: glutaredoxin family protein [Spirochaetaceae bacterium]
MAITVYTTPSCVYCTKVKSFFRELKVPFTEYDVARDARRAEEMQRRSGQSGVPVVDVNGRVIVGFNEAEIRSALKR